MGSYRCRIGFPKEVDIDTAQFSVVGKSITLTLTTGTNPGTADFFISAGQGAITFDGSASSHAGVIGPNRAVAAGDIIEFAAGTHGSRTLLKIVGTAANPVIIRGPQTTGQAVIQPTNTPTFTMPFKACRFVHVDGLSPSNPSCPIRPDGKRHGIKIVGSGAFNALIKFQGTGGATYDLTRNITIGGLELDGSWDTIPGASGGHGIATNDHNILLSAYPGSWQERIIIEDCYFHNFSSSATYVGFNTYQYSRPGMSPDTPLRYIKIRNNYFADIGGRGILCKTWFGGTPGGDDDTSSTWTENSIHDNILIRCGLNTDPSNDGRNAIELLSAKTSCYNNIIENCGAHGINSTVTEGTTAGDPNGIYIWRHYNNLIRRCGTIDSGKSGMNFVVVNGFGSSTDPRLQLFCNTITQMQNNGDAINIPSGTSSVGHPNFQASSLIENNIFVDNPGGIGSSGGFSTTKNLTTGTAAATFVDASGSIEAGTVDFNLIAAAPVAVPTAQGSGDSGSWGATVNVPDVDIEGQARAALTADMGAYEK